MASGKRNHRRDSSPPAFDFTQQGHENLLNTQQPFDFPDIPMPDLDVKSTLPLPADQNTPTTDSHVQTSAEIVELDNTDGSTTGSGDTLFEKEAKNSDTTADTQVEDSTHSNSGEIHASDSDRIKALLGDNAENDEGDTEKPKDSSLSSEPQHPGEGKEVLIKREIEDWAFTLSGFKPGEVIDLDDEEDDVAEIPRNDLLKKTHPHDSTVPYDIIEISDGEEGPEEIIIYDDGSTSVAIKKENQDVEFMGANTNLVDIAAESSSSEDEPEIAPSVKLGKSLLRTPNPRSKRGPEQIARMKQLQKLYAEKALGRSMKIGAGGIFKAPQLAENGNTSSEDGFAWMSDTVLPDDKPAADFQALKQAYRAKRKSRKNTLEDDVKFKQAQIAENKRLKRLAQETFDSESSDEAEESDDRLFVSEKAPSKSKNNLLSISVDDEEDDDVEAVLTKMLTEKSAPKPKPKTAASSTELSSKRSRAKALEKELRYNMLAGIEAHILKDQKRLEDKAAKEAEAEAVAKGAKVPQKRKKGNQFDIPAKRTKTGRMNNVQSLLTSNIYEDSNANLNKKALPVVSEKKKKDFLSSLIANLPLADQKQANADRIDIFRASKILAKYKVVPDGKGNWSFKGMKSSLYHHQVQGAAYMKLREQGEQAPFGGILADEMGLGKTIQTLSLMAANPQLDPNDVKCTLVVCSPALLLQWEKELDDHTEKKTFPRVTRHHGTTRFSGKGAVENMESTDVILTTYGEVVRSYPNCMMPKDLITPAEKEAWWLKEWDEKRDLLHRAQFYRVVLDEAQAIKNHTSQTSIACRALMARHRWAISGTPIQNRLDELFPYFKFLRVKHTGSMGVFRQNFCLKNDDVCNKRLHSMLDGMMIRRCHQDQVLGHPLIKLPENTQQTLRLKFNNVERHLYEVLKLRCVRTINAVGADGTIEEQTKAVIMMFQRLRQMVSHIFMVQEMLEKEFELDDAEKMWKNLITDNPDHTDSEEAMLVALKKIIAEKGTRSNEGRGNGFQFTNPKEQSETTATKKKKGSLLYRFGKCLKDLKKHSKWAELRERSMCHGCGQPPEEPWVTSCMHVYCKECLNNLAYDASHLDLDHTACGSCGAIFTESVPCEGLKELGLRDLSASIFQDGRGKAPAEKAFKLTMDYVDSKDGLLLSTKAAAVKEQFAKWIAEDPDCKIIVFTEWLLVMHVLGRVCQKEGWSSCHYNGKMTHKARDEALSAFRDDDQGNRSGVQVLIASLKCGGTGLNLTVASRVICVDLWFNSCVEQQAFARVFRIGQTQKTYITRCIVEDTVDERLIEMQEEKRAVISHAMDDRSIMAQLTLPELLRLFGPVAYDENSKPFIMVDDDYALRANLPTLVTDD